MASTKMDNWANNDLQNTIQNNQWSRNTNPSVEGDRNTGTHHTEARIVDSSTEELEQSNAAHAIVDSSTKN
jgi:hypothetical protein